MVRGSSRTVGENAAPARHPDPGRASGVLRRDGVRRLTGTIDEVRPRSCATTCRPASPVDQGGTPDPQMHRGHDAPPTHRVPARPARRLLLLPDRLHRAAAVRDDGRRGAHPGRRRARLGGPRRAQRRGRRHRHGARRPAAGRRRRPARPAPGPRPAGPAQRGPAGRLRARRRQQRPGPRRPGAVGAHRRQRAAGPPALAHPPGRDHQAAGAARPPGDAAQRHHGLRVRRRRDGLHRRPVPRRAARHRDRPLGRHRRRRGAHVRLRHRLRPAPDRPAPAEHARVPPTHRRPPASWRARS